MLGYEVIIWQNSLENLDNILKIEVPSFRPDIEGEADIVEEILRFYGFI